MGHIIIPNAIERKKNCLYYIDGEGNICETKMNHGSKSRLEKKEKENK